MQVHLEIPEDLAKQLAPEPGDLTRAAIEGSLWRAFAPGS